MGNPWTLLEQDDIDTKDCFLLHRLIPSRQYIKTVEWMTRGDSISETILIHCTTRELIVRSISNNNVKVIQTSTFPEKISDIEVIRFSSIPFMSSDHPSSSEDPPRQYRRSSLPIQEHEHRQQLLAILWDRPSISFISVEEHFIRSKAIWRFIPKYTKHFSPSEGLQPHYKMTVDPHGRAIAISPLRGILHVCLISNTSIIKDYSFLLKGTLWHMFFLEPTKSRQYKSLTFVSIVFDDSTFKFRIVIYEITASQCTKHYDALLSQELERPHLAFSASGMPESFYIVTSTSIFAFKYSKLLLFREPTPTTVASSLPESAIKERSSNSRKSLEYRSSSLVDDRAQIILGSHHSIAWTKFSHHGKSTKGITIPCTSIMIQSPGTEFYLGFDTGDLVHVIASTAMEEQRMMVIETRFLDHFGSPSHFCHVSSLNSLWISGSLSSNILVSITNQIAVTYKESNLAPIIDSESLDGILLVTGGQEYGGYVNTYGLWHLHSTKTHTDQQYGNELMTSQIHSVHSFEIHWNNHYLWNMLAISFYLGSSYHTDYFMSLKDEDQEFQCVSLLLGCPTTEETLLIAEETGERDSYFLLQATEYGVYLFVSRGEPPYLLCLDQIRYEDRILFASHTRLYVLIATSKGSTMLISVDENQGRFVQKCCFRNNSAISCIQLSLYDDCDSSLRAAIGTYDGTITIISIDKGSYKVICSTNIPDILPHSIYVIYLYDYMIGFIGTRCGQLIVVQMNKEHDLIPRYIQRYSLDSGIPLTVKCYGKEIFAHNLDGRIYHIRPSRYSLSSGIMSWFLLHIRPLLFNEKSINSVIHSTIIDTKTFPRILRIEQIKSNIIYSIHSVSLDTQSMMISNHTYKKPFKQIQTLSKGFSIGYQINQSKGSCLSDIYLLDESICKKASMRLSDEIVTSMHVLDDHCIWIGLYSTIKRKCFINVYKVSTKDDDAFKLSQMIHIDDGSSNNIQNMCKGLDCMLVAHGNVIRLFYCDVHLFSWAEYANTRSGSWITCMNVVTRDDLCFVIVGDSTDGVCIWQITFRYDGNARIWSFVPRFYDKVFRPVTRIVCNFNYPVINIIGVDSNECCFSLLASIEHHERDETVQTFKQIFSFQLNDLVYSKIIPLTKAAPYSSILYYDNDVFNDNTLTGLLTRYICLNNVCKGVIIPSCIGCIFSIQSIPSIAYNFLSIVWGELKTIYDNMFFTCTENINSVLDLNVIYTIFYFLDISEQEQLCERIAEKIDNIDIAPVIINKKTTKDQVFNSLLICFEYYDHDYADIS